MRLLSWNLHGFVGTDGVFDPVRIAEAVHTMRPDVAAFQEVDLRRHGTELLLPLQAAVGAHSVGAQALGGGQRWYGQLLASRYPIVEQTVHDTTFRTREPRRVIEATLRTGGGPIRVLAAHLGLKWTERRHQFRRIREIAAARPDVPTVLVGDLNEWRPLPGFARMALGPGARASARRLVTFPSQLPLLALDRVIARPAQILESARTERRWRRASDHLPLLAEIATDA